MRTLRFLLRKEYLQIFRDRVMLAQILLVPIVQLAILANAATFEVRSARLYVVDEDRSASSRRLVSDLTASGRFILTRASVSAADADEALLDRAVDAVLHVPREFERDLVRERAGEVQLVLSAEDGAAAGVSRSYAQRIVNAFAAERAAALRPSSAAVGATRPGGAPPVRGTPRVEVRTRGWYNAELDYKHYMVPGILVQLVTIIGTMLTAINIAREKELGTLDQLNVTPVTRSQFIAGKLVPLWSIGLVELTLGLVAAAWVFGIPIRGSIPLVFAMTAVYLLATLGLGLWISTLADTQQQAMFITFFVLMIYLLMSGLFTPIRSMPPWAQWLAQLNPMMHFVAIVRAIILRGATFGDVARPFAVLVAYAAVVFTFAVRQYSKRVG